MITDILSLNFQDNLSINSALIKKIFDENFQYNLKIVDTINLNLIDNIFIHGAYSHKVKDLILQEKTQYSYEEIINLFRDLSHIVDNFLPDWYTLRYLQKESILDRASIARVAVALSNLFRLAVDNEIDEIHLVTLRIRKMFIEEINKYVFIITDY